ncbi:MAG: polysaccharide biosynthesis/export family protein [Elusimicrobiota bacterium]|nr:polysaccharide biosynthesis/export family protein [Elusimicrobiota bacterium]
MKSGVFLVLSLSLLAACAPQRPGARLHPVVKPSDPAALAAVKPETPQQEAGLEQRLIENALGLKNQSQLNYKIQSGDLIEITVFKETDMSRTARVSGNGTITFPLAGNIKLSELTVPEAEALLAEKLSEFLVKPQVTAFIKEYSNKQIYVLGEVKKPGSIQIPAERRLTVLEAITLSGGFTDLAAPDRTKILRGAGSTSQSIQVEVNRITKLGDKSADIFLEPNDTVYVPQSFF